MIPKIIHLCWFGGGRYPRDIKLCLKSLKKVLPDYKIMLWDYEKALSTGFPYVKEALEAKKWAFAADVVRLYAVYTYGGLYMDTDIRLFKRFDSFLEGHGASFFIESHNFEGQEPCLGIQAAFFAAQKGNEAVGKVLDYYRDRHFRLEDGSLDIADIAPAKYARALEPLGFEYVDKKIELSLDAVVWPSRFVAGNYYELTEDSFCIHLCDHSWASSTFSESWKLFKWKTKIILKEIFLRKGGFKIYS